MLIRYVYIVFIGVLLALFVGVGIAAFYPSPKNPESQIYPTKSFYEPNLTSTESAELRRQDIEQQKVWQKFNDETQEYNKNVSIIAVAAAILILIVSLTLVSKILILADGLLLGGVLTLLYSIGRGFGSNDEKFRFVVVTIGLIVALFLGYLKFIKNSLKKD